MTTKTKIIALFVLLFAIWFVFWGMYIIPYIQKGMKITEYQQQIQKNKDDWARCENIQLSWHIENVVLMNKLNAELGLPMQAQSAQRTWVQVQEIITLTWK